MSNLNTNFQQSNEDDGKSNQIHQSKWINEAANSSSYTYKHEVFDMSQFALNGQSKEMKRKMLEDKFILKDIAILGQWTVIYAPPNAGKTLISLKLIIESIQSGVINGEDIYYINADDTYKGFQQKLEVAEKYNFNMLMPGGNNFEVNKFQTYLKKMIRTGNAKGKVIVLDTLKKFTNLMDKSLSSEFGTLIRDFVSHGGSVICLAHVNKHKDESGKSIHSGTSDVKDDCDCCYIVDVIDSNSALKTVEFRNEKNRGDVARKITFKYQNQGGASYLEILESVHTISEHQANALRVLNESGELLKANADLISSIENAIKFGVSQKTLLVEHVREDTGETKAKINKVLKEHTGVDFAAGHRWKCDIGDKNAKTYSLLVMIDSSAA